MQEFFILFSQVTATVFIIIKKHMNSYLTVNVAVLDLEAQTKWKKQNLYVLQLQHS